MGRADASLTQTPSFEAGLAQSAEKNMDPGEVQQVQRAAKELGEGHNLPDAAKKTP